jgi:adenylate kinase family enzyme
MQRVLILGCSGAGKSTFSRRLAAITGLPRIELDHAFWRPGWVTPPREEWLQTVAALCERPAWIMDGNYSSSLHLRLPRADTVILLDYARQLCLWRVLSRIAKGYGQAGKGTPAGCPEQLDLEFLRYVWNFDKRTKPKLLAALKTRDSHLRLFPLKSDRDAERLLAELSKTLAALPDIETGEPQRC